MTRVPLNDTRRKYLADYLNLAGYAGLKLADSDLEEMFYWLARVEEFSTGVRFNRHNWEVSSAPIPRREKQFIPIVDHKMAGKLGDMQGKFRWPEGKSFCLCLTHDVDRMRRFVWKERLRNFIAAYQDSSPKGLKAKLFASACYNAAKSILALGKDKDYSLANWIEVERAHGFRSTFFFLTPPEYPISWEDAFYGFSDRMWFYDKKTKVSDIIKHISDSGWEVGLHGSTLSHSDTKVLARQRAQLGKVANCEIISLRQHHLAYDIRHTPQAQAAAGFLVDASLGFNRTIGFRCGTSLPFQMYDYIGDRPLGIFQVPLIIQDIALFEESSGDIDVMMGQIRELMDRVQAVNGVLCVLWHNNAAKDSALFRSYELMLGEANKRNAWGCSVKQLYQHYTGRT